MPHPLEVPVEQSLESGVRRSLRGWLLPFSLVFAASFVALFFGMSLRPNFYDEGLILTGAVRVLHGQIPYRDFYANYGPAQFYILAALFRVFGESVLVERLFDLLLKATLVASVYRLLQERCGRAVTLWACVGLLLWLFALYGLSGTPIIAVALLSLLATARLLPVWEGDLLWRGMMLCGAYAGLCALFRPDMGLALMTFHACFVAIAIVRRSGRGRDGIRTFVDLFWPYPLGFFLITLPAAAYYLVRAPLGAFLHDLVIYPARHYHSGRNLPFPGIRLKTLDNLIIYLLLLIIAFAWYAAVRELREGKEDEVARARPKAASATAFLTGFGLLAAVMYGKGIVRVSPSHLFASILPSILLLAMLYERRAMFPDWMRLAVVALTGLFALATATGAAREARDLKVFHASALEYELLAARHAVPAGEASWCAERSPLTRGMCFASDEGRLETIEYLDRHSAPGQSLFVGVTHHDKIFANDNLIYFAAQRMPGTRWSHFDPGLQNDATIQAEMVRDLERSAPPLVVVDSELDESHEPNDSSKSTGVTLLDDYLHSHYRQVEQFSEMTIFARQLPSPEAGRRLNITPAAP